MLNVFSLLQHIQAGRRAHPASYSIDSGFSSVLKRPRRDVNHPSSSTAEIKNEWSYTSTPPIWLHGVNRDSFTHLYFLSSCLQLPFSGLLSLNFGTLRFTVNLKYYKKSRKLSGTTGFKTARGYRTRRPYETAISLWKKHLSTSEMITHFLELTSSK
jgi:hypothetical protein